MEVGRTEKAAGGQRPAAVFELGLRRAA